MNFLEKMSQFEKRDLLLAWLCLAIAFTLCVSGGLVLITNNDKISIGMLMMTFIVAVITAGLSFVLHELAHKFTAIRYGYWAEFRKNTQMLLMAIVVAVIVGIVFAAPGATLINTTGREMTKKENGIISLAGPLTNLILTIPFLFCLTGGVLLGGAASSTFTFPGFLCYLGIMGIQVNAMLAFFNMLPIGHLDGKKILHWNAMAFATLITVSFLVLYVSLRLRMFVVLLS